MKTRILLIAMMMFCTAFAISQTSYYYYKGNKVSLQKEAGRFSVISSKGTQQTVPIGFRQTAYLDDALYDIAIYETNTPSGGRFSPVISTNLFPAGAIIMQAYRNPDGLQLALTNYLNVKLKKETDYPLLLNMASKYGLNNIKQNKFMPLWYSMSITSSTPEGTLEIANDIYESGLFASAFPDFTFDALECSYDPDFSKQWGLYNSDYADIDISICSAWNYATGRGIKIAIVDEGIDMSHPDLAPNIYSLSYDTETGTSPARRYGSHGTHCAGIAAAVRNNGLKIAGVAPDAKLMSISNRLMGGPNAARNLADGINWAWKNGADIISCSWRSGENDMIADAIDGAIEHGREGKGVIFVKSAGNQSGGPITWPGYYRPEVLTVGSINIDGAWSSFASVGDAMDVAAPGSNIWSTFPNNSVGYDSGTSMAAPHAAGLAALILERNPALTGQQVRDIIEKNTKKVGSTPYNTIKANGSWNNSHGYGLINAYEAVKNTPRR